jgi:hypothetical protein
VRGGRRRCSERVREGLARSMEFLAVLLYKQASRLMGIFNAYKKDPSGGRVATEGEDLFDARGGALCRGPCFGNEVGRGRGEFRILHVKARLSCSQAQ